MCVRVCVTLLLPTYFTRAFCTNTQCYSRTITHRMRLYQGELVWCSW